MASLRGETTTQTARSILHSINSPADLRRVDASKLKEVANELRQETIDAVAVTGGHLGASLGVIELTVALRSRNIMRKRASGKARANAG